MAVFVQTRPHFGWPFLPLTAVNIWMWLMSLMTINAGSSASAQWASIQKKDSVHAFGDSWFCWAKPLAKFSSFFTVAVATHGGFIAREIEVSTASNHIHIVCQGLEAAIVFLCWVTSFLSFLWSTCCCCHKVWCTISFA